MTTKKYAMVAALLTTGMLTTSACGTDSSTSSGTGDPAYMYEAASAVRESSTFHVREPETLADSLPNRNLVAKTEQGEVRTNWSDLVLSGTITDVRPGSALNYPDPETATSEDEAEPVEFDSPDADSYNVLVTVRPEWSSGAAVEDEVEVRIGVVGGADPETFMDSLRGMSDNQTVMVLDARESGQHKGDYAPIMGATLLGQVGDSGTLEFPALGEEEAKFLGAVTTLEALKAEAAKPAQDVVLN